VCLTGVTGDCRAAQVGRGPGRSDRQVGVSANERGVRRCCSSGDEWRASSAVRLFYFESSSFHRTQKLPLISTC